MAEPSRSRRASRASRSTEPARRRLSREPLTRWRRRVTSESAPWPARPQRADERARDGLTDARDDPAHAVRFVRVLTVGSRERTVEGSLTTTGPHRREASREARPEARDSREHAPQRGEDVIRGRGAVDNDPPVRLRGREREIRRANALVERAIEVRLEPGGLRGRLAGQPDLDGEIEEDRAVGPQAARGKPEHRAQLIERQLAAAALVRERRVRVPVGDHEGTATECRPDHLVDELDARSAEEERVGALRQADPDRAGVHEDRADTLACPLYTSPSPRDRTR